MNEFSGLLRFLLEAIERGERTALVTITEVIGSSPRAPGTHMAVSETGDYFGSVSGGCVEAAVVTEAKRVLETGRAEQIRFGKGSDFIDIRLPCGGGMDLLFTPHPAQEAMAEALRCHEARRDVTLALGRAGGVELSDRQSGSSAWSAETFYALHPPRLRLCILGRGTEARWLARLAAGLGADVCVATPDETLLEEVEQSGGEAHSLATATSALKVSFDSDTAVILLFHDHDWELDLLDKVLCEPALFIGAMGSRRAQEQRLAAMRDRGTDEAALKRITGPVGLIPAARDPQTLALSVLAQVVACYNEARAQPR